MQFTSEQLAPEQEQARHWHMWLRGERCGRAPDDEGMRMGGGGGVGGRRGGGREMRTLRGEGGKEACCQTRVCQFLATGHVLRHSLTASLYREDKDR